MHFIAFIFFTSFTFGAIRSSKIESHVPDFNLTNEELEFKYCKNFDYKNRHALAGEDYKWDDGIVYYEISPKFNSTGRSMIEAAMYQIERHSCIRFRRRKHEMDYAYISKGSNCFVYPGRRGGRQELILSTSKCFSRNIIIQFLMGTAGFVWEHMRPDRDDYIRVLWSNVESGEQHSFCKAPKGITTFPDAYDFNSIMHFTKYFLSRDKTSPTIVAKTGVEIGPENGSFSKTDLIKIKKLYDCSKSQPPLTTDLEYVE